MEHPKWPFFALFATFLNLGGVHFHSKKSETCLKESFCMVLSFHLVIKKFDIFECRYVTISEAKIAFFCCFYKKCTFFQSMVKVGTFCEKFIKSSKNWWKCSSTNLLYNSKILCKKHSKKAVNYIWKIHNFLYFRKLGKKLNFLHAHFRAKI